MGLLDILNGMQNGPRGQQQPSRSGSESSGGMSPIMMALLGLLALQGVQKQERPSCRSRRFGPADTSAVWRRHECRKSWWWAR